MSSDCSLPLSCLIYGSDIARTGDMAAWVKACDGISQIAEVTRLSSLRDHLSQSAYDFVVIILEHADDNLPACILRYPELKVLAVTPARKIHRLDSWLAQGASDVVSAQRSGKCRHALQRMAEESQVRAQLRLASKKLASQHRLQQILLDSRDEAVLLWQNGTVLESNCHLDELIECHALDKQSRSIEWKRWISASCYARLHSKSEPAFGKLMISNHRGAQHRAVIEPLFLDDGEAQLIRLSKRAIDNPTLEEKNLDTTTGVLLPDTFVNAMDSWLQNTSKRRYTIAQIQIVEPGLHSEDNAANSTVEELLSYRIANLLQEEFKKGSLIGRTGANAMTLLSFKSHRHSRELSARIRKCLGTVGDLIEDTNCIRIKTLTLAPNALGTQEVIKRLSQWQSVQPRCTTRAASPNRNAGEEIPVLSVRA